MDKTQDKNNILTRDNFLDEYWNKDKYTLSIPYFITKIDYIPKLTKKIKFLNSLTCNQTSIYNILLPELPNSLIKLSLGTNFDSSIDNIQYLNNLTHLIFGYKFNKSVDKLPNSMQFRCCCTSKSTHRCGRSDI